MAVSFKVPKSPKRDIFVIDEFKGVDLTNTGANIEETRSPNAENMVRYVPGKVRKRTGYQTKVEFSDRKDVNRVLGTSDEYVEINVTGTNYGTANFLYDLAENVVNPWVYADLDLIGTYRIGVRFTDGNGFYTEQTGTPSAHLKYSWINVVNGKAAEKIYIYRTSNDPDDYIKIKNFRIVGKADTVATNSTEWCELPWSAAPEDNGVIFKRETNAMPVYGCHFLRSGTFDGNRVTNVNRALLTSDSFVSYTLNDTTYTKLYDLGNMIYKSSDGTKYTMLYYEFDYISDGEADVQIAGHSTTVSDILDTSGATYHYSGQLSAGDFNFDSVRAKAASGTVNLQIKNFSVMYQKDAEYVWSAAPEDIGKEFAIADVYNVGSKNYATIDEYISNTASGTYSIPIADSSFSSARFCKVSFDLYFMTQGTSITDVTAVPNYFNGSGHSYHGTWVKSFGPTASNVHAEFYVCEDSPGYINNIYVTYTGSAGTGTVSLRVSNIEVREITGRDSYDISSKNYIYHVGNKFFLRAGNSTKVTEIYASANQHLSKSWQLNEKLFILDGKNIYSYAVGDESVEVLTAGSGYIPTVTISKVPGGASSGVSYEALNMLQPGFYELFGVDTAHASEKTFKLSFDGLDSTTTKAWVLDDDGNWNEKLEGTHYSVNRGTGTITFVTAPGSTMSAAMLSSGEDNVKILAYRTVPGYADRVAKCTIGTLFGVGGAADRLFLSGNPDYPNWDFYSEQYNPTYFPDLGYSSLGSAASAIVGYAIINNYLATFKDDFDSSQAVFIREGDLVVDSNTGTSEPAFRLINTLQGNGVVAPYSFGYLQTEPLFLTRSGIYAITAQDITGEKYSQNRSFYLDGKLTKESGLENAVATVFKDQYVLALNNQLYILDGLQATRTDRSEPYATRQYVAFYCTNVPAISIWTDDQALWIGTSDGKVCRFATDIEDLESYSDNGEAIYACWETPDLDGKLFYKNKTFRYFAIRLMKSLRTSVKIFAQKRGNWSTDPIKEDRQSGLAFDFNTIDFTNFSFSTDRSEKVVHTKVRIKKVDKARFRVENGYVNEPFGLFDLALEYIESGNYKG